MYDTRWPRPGPAMAVVAAVLGLVAGAILGLSSPGAAPTAQASAPPETTVAPTTTTLPEEFHTVVLGSYDERANADARLREVRGPWGSRTPVSSSRRSTTSRTHYAVYSGHFDTQDEAEAHLEELAGYGIPANGRFYKKVTRSD